MRQRIAYGPIIKMTNDFGNRNLANLVQKNQINVRPNRGIQQTLLSSKVDLTQFLITTFTFIHVVVSQTIQEQF